MKPTLLILHWRDGREERISCELRPLPPRVSHRRIEVATPGGDGATVFTLGAEREQFLHVKHREVLCRVANYFEVAT